MYGIFDGDRLVATSSLLHDVRAYADNTELSEVMKHSCIEIGESMVLPEYRGNGYMLRLNNLIKDEAKRQGVEYMLATAHPDNIASNTYCLSSWLSSGERVYTMWIQKKSSCSGLE